MNNNFFNKAFKGRKVPENIKKISMEICRRFVINGICDPMYITNTIAYENNIGNGKGEFTGNVITRIKETAEKIQNSYGCNILKSEIQEIECCLMNGYIENIKAIEGLKNYKSRIEEELKTCDIWRIDYLNSVLLSIDESMNYYSL